MDDDMMNKPAGDDTGTDTSTSDPMPSMPAEGGENKEEGAADAGSGDMGGGMGDSTPAA